MPTITSHFNGRSDAKKFRDFVNFAIDRQLNCYGKTLLGFEELIKKIDPNAPKCCVLLFKPDNTCLKAKRQQMTIRILDNKDKIIDSHRFEY